MMTYVGTPLLLLQAVINKLNIMKRNIIEDYNNKLLILVVATGGQEREVEKHYQTDYLST